MYSKDVGYNVFIVCALVINLSMLKAISFFVFEMVGVQRVMVLIPYVLRALARVGIGLLAW